MAFATHSTHTHAGVAGTVDSLRARFTTWRARRAAFVQTFNELDALTDRELADLGVHRTEIGRIAREARGRI